MIYQLSTKYQRHIAAFMLFIFYASTATASWNNNRAINYPTIGRGLEANINKNNKARLVGNEMVKNKNFAINNKLSVVEDDDIGGPTQPEMSSFKSVDANNLVNLFTGDFSYNIPLLDVGGYPVNIFYSGGITPDQEASWVGLGWNINPGTINRNMRGIPDEFDGTDIMTQVQDMKANKTWGVRLGADQEIAGIKSLLSAGTGISFGVSFNNYLGPALEYGVKGSTGFSLGKKAGTEKSPFQATASYGLNLSSRDGATFSGGVSVGYTAKLKGIGESLSMGLGASTSYNSRSGIRSLQISDQLSWSKKNAVQKDACGDVVQKANKAGISATLFSTSISFVKPSYMPAMRMPVTHTSGSGHFQLGVAWDVFEGTLEAEIYAQKSKIKEEDKTQKKPMYGYFNYEKANGDNSAMLDFVRLGDKEVTPTTPIISAPNYTYDVFAISGEGTGGTIRAYRNDLGSVHDNYTRTKDENWSAGIDIGPPSQYGANFNTIHTPSKIYEWGDNNFLRSAIPFTSANGTYENVYFRNPGETSVLNVNEYDNIGGTDLVRWKLGGDGRSPQVLPTLERMNKSDGTPIIPASNINVKSNNLTRKKRTQVINFLSAEEASKAGLDQFIKSYDASTLLNSGHNLKFEKIDRVGGYRQKHHISQINVTESDGKRYVYGIPVYNIMQQDFTFTVGNGVNTDKQVSYNTSEKTNVNEASSQDGYIQSTKTPAYAHSFLLSGLLSPDYVDVTGDGITEDDLGNAVKFNYTKVDQVNYPYKWRAPYTKATNLANFNDGNRTEGKDNKGLVSYGERESWYTHSIESKTMIAIFTLSNREDGKGVLDEDGGINVADNTLKKLDKIDLYSKADLKLNGLSGAKPIKTVHFEYNYNLCGNTPDNAGNAVDILGSATSASASDNVNKKMGRLTLTKIYFTFNGQNKANKNQYVFGYGDINNLSDNPNYAYNSADRWGNYKSKTNNPGSLDNADFPYSIQNKNQTNYHPTATPNESIENEIKANVSAWCLKTILLPSGGQIEVDYEADSYSYVQDKNATVMMQIKGFGHNTTSMNNHLYEISFASITENDYVFVTTPQALTEPNSTTALGIQKIKDEINIKYLHLNAKKENQLAFKLMVRMPKGYEYIPVYAVIEDYGRVNANEIWIKLKEVDGVSPLSLATIDYLRTSLPGQAYPGYDVSEQTTLSQIGSMLIGLWDGLASSVSNPVNYLRVMRTESAQKVDLSKSFVRLCSPTGSKYGGGNRVKSVTLKDNWNAMTGQFTSSYGQEYEYTTKEPITGNLISSGVASYEPSIGGDENPFQEMLQIANSIPLGPTSYSAIEMPVLDALFPAPSVGYSKVTVKSIKRFDGKAIAPNDLTIKPKSHSGIGKQVTEFYTAKDFPVKCSYSNFDGTSNLEEHKNSTTWFFWKYAFDSKAQSQGFLVETNDMHGKMKSQASYPENDETTAINYTENFYKNTGVNGLTEPYDFVSNAAGGLIIQGNIGVDIELMTDTREFEVASFSTEIQAQVDIIYSTIIPIPIPFVWGVYGESQNVYRAVTTTKTVNYHSVVDKVVVIDKGSEVSTENLVYDAETGQVIVNRTKNEFNDYIHNTTYPAYWAYSGMGLAYKNIDAVYKNVKFLDGRIVPDANLDITTIKSVFESGDEVYLISDGAIPTDACGAALASTIPENRTLWVFDADKNTSDGLTNSNVDHTKLYFINDKGQPFTRDNVNIRIIRSGKRNMLGATVQTVTSMASPIVAGKLNFAGNTKVVSASEIEYKEKWQTDNDVFKKYKMTIDNTPIGSNLITNGDFSLGNVSVGSSYVYTNANQGGYPQGVYNVGNNVLYFNSYMDNCGDHTSTPDNNMLMVNGATTAGKVVWSQTISVLSNSNYDFSYWVQNISTSTTDLANLRVTINGVQIGNDYLIFPQSCIWTNFYKSWYSGAITSANIKIIDISDASAGNDFAIDDIEFYQSPSCEKIIVEDCSGDYENSINPYCKGILGTFRNFRSKVLYTNRNEIDPILPATTNISSNGFINNFVPCWEFNASHNLINTSADQWVENNQITRINSRGQELETKNALDIFTAAQYGYNKNLPLAIANNSKSSQMFYEGFEDNNFNESLNNVNKNICADKHIALTSDVSSLIISSNSADGTAHTGEKMIKIPAHTSKQIIQKAISNENISNQFNLDLKLDYVKEYNDLGVGVINLYNASNTDPTNIFGPTVCTINPDFPITELNGVNPNSVVFKRNDAIWGYLFASYGANSIINGLVSAENSHRSPNIYGTSPLGSYTIIPNIVFQYVEIKNEGFYTFSLNQNDQFDGFPGAPSGGYPSINYCRLSLFQNGVKIDEIIGSNVLQKTSNMSCDASNSKVVKLCAGYYKIQMISYQRRLNDQQSVGSSISYSLASTNITDAIGYRSLSPILTCPNSIPIKGNSDMMNPIFGYSKGKKMLFSAWVKEECSSSPCNKISYDLTSKVTMNFGAGTAPVTIKPTGNIIDGWQKMEGEFVIPANASLFNLRLVNSGSTANYWDDIRVHPFNANMKSYVYDPISLRLVADLDENNYAKFYEYDDEGTLIRTKAETKEGIKTIVETRSAKQKTIIDIVH